jgi:hypothetical protein
MRCNLLAELVFDCTEGKIPNVNARTHHRTSGLPVIVGFGRTDLT